MTLAVSVIIPTYNHARFLGQAIESALRQTLPPIEVIVVDDGSQDETSKVLTHYNNRVRVLCQQNRGVAAARNAGAKLASGKLLAFLDADDVWLPHKLECQVARLQSTPGLGLVHCGVEEIDGTGRLLGKRTDGLEGRVADELLLFRCSVILGGGSGVLIPRDVFTRIGGFDERLSTSADWDLYYRIAARYHVGFVTEVLLQYRLHGANMHGNIRAMEHDMLLAFDKAFNDADHFPSVSRRRAFGNLHTVLAGAFFATGAYSKFIQHAWKGLMLTPGNATRYLGYPLRWWQRYHSSRETVTEAIG